MLGPTASGRDNNSTKLGSLHAVLLRSAVVLLVVVDAMLCSFVLICGLDPFVVWEVTAVGAHRSHIRINDL